ncbi:MAG: hypothetical protein U1F77_09520 [Kiritimatiellia bacterium]
MADAATSPSALRAGWPSCRACCSPCLRLPELGLEADAHRRTVQAGTTGRLLDEGFAYRYDPVEYHGPTLYYFTVPLAHLRGRDGFRQLDETTLRLVPALFGAGLLLWLPLFRGVLGFRGIAFSALLLASGVHLLFALLHPGDAHLVFFSLGLAASLARLRSGGRGVRWAVVADRRRGHDARHEGDLRADVRGDGRGGRGGGWAGRPFRLPAHWKRGVVYFAMTAAILLSSVFLSSFLANPRGRWTRSSRFSIMQARRWQTATKNPGGGTRGCWRGTGSRPGRSFMNWVSWFRVWADWRCCRDGAGGGPPPPPACSPHSGSSCWRGCIR